MEIKDTNMGNSMKVKTLGKNKFKGKSYKTVTLSLNNEYKTKLISDRYRTHLDNFSQILNNSLNFLCILLNCFYLSFKKQSDGILNAFQSTFHYMRVQKGSCQK